MRNKNSEKERETLVQLIANARKVMKRKAFKAVHLRLKNSRRPIQAWRKTIKFAMKGGGYA